MAVWLTGLDNVIVAQLCAACIQVNHTTICLSIVRFWKTEVTCNEYLILQLSDYALCHVYLE